MELPDTENANHHYAFKKGYRLGMEGKPMTHMPSNIRHDAKMREYFQMGWEQYQEELSEAKENEAKPAWRSRFAWMFMMVFAGIGTATLMVNNMEAERKEQQAKIDGTYQPPKPKTVEPSIETTEKITRPGDFLAQNPAKTASESEMDLALTESLSLIDDTPAITPQAIEPASQPANITEPIPLADAPTSDINRNEDLSLKLISDQEMQDLQANLAEREAEQQANQIELTSVESSSITIAVAELTNAVKDRAATELFTDLVPKYVRRLYLFTQVKGAEGDTVYHRWIYNNQVMATVPLTIKSPLYRTWSSKRLSSAWSGQWYVEVLDSDKKVIYRKPFTYIK